MKMTGGMKSSGYILVLIVMMVLAWMSNTLIIGTLRFLDWGTPLDRWFVKYFFGDFGWGLPLGWFVPVLLEFYFLNFIFGFLIPTGLMRGSFRDLYAKGFLEFSEKRLVLVNLDIIVISNFMWFAFDRILAYLIQYPWWLPEWWLSPWSSESFIFLYSFAGFITGNTLGKSIFPLQVHLESKRRHMRVEIQNPLGLGAERKRKKRSKRERWVFLPEA